MTVADRLTVAAHHVPPDADPGADPVLGSYRAFRARVMHDGGRRPEFRAADGAFVDDQDADLGAWHIAVRTDPDGPVAGYMRLTTPASPAPFQAMALLGAARFDAVLAETGLAAHEAFEPARVVVDAGARGLGLGAVLPAAMVALARRLGAVALIGTCGAVNGIYRHYRRFGFDVVPGSWAHVERYADDVCVMVNRRCADPVDYEQLVDRVDDLLTRSPSAEEA